MSPVAAMFVNLCRFLFLPSAVLLRRDMTPFWLDRLWNPGTWGIISLFTDLSLALFFLKISTKRLTLHLQSKYLEYNISSHFWADWSRPEADKLSKKWSPKKRSSKKRSSKKRSSKSRREILRTVWSHGTVSVHITNSKPELNLINHQQFSLKKSDRLHHFH